MDCESLIYLKSKMISKVYFMFTIIHMTYASVVPDVRCDRIRMGNNWYEKEFVWSKQGKPYNLNIHKVSNTLFFSYSMPESYSDMDFQLAFFDLDTGEHQVIAGIKGGCSVAIDQINDDIYLGGSDGIYKYNMLTKLADFYQEKGKNIWSLFFKKNLFYISYPDQKLHIQYDGKFANVKEFEDIEIDQFHVSNNNVIYFANKTGFYRYDNEKMAAETLSDLITVRQIVEDNEGITYLCTNIGVFVVSSTDGFKKVLDIKNMYGLTFDRDNSLIYSDEKNIIRLKYSTVRCDKNLPQW